MRNQINLRQPKKKWQRKKQQGYKQVIIAQRGFKNFPPKYEKNQKLHTKKQFHNQQSFLRFALWICFPWTFQSSLPQNRPLCYLVDLCQDSRHDKTEKIFRSSQYFSPISSFIWFLSCFLLFFTFVSITLISIFVNQLFLHFADWQTHFASL